MLKSQNDNKTIIEKFICLSFDEIEIKKAVCFDHEGQQFWDLIPKYWL